MTKTLTGIDSPGFGKVFLIHDQEGAKHPKRARSKRERSSTKMVFSVYLDTTNEEAARQLIVRVAESFERFRDVDISDPLRLVCWLSMKDVDQRKRKGYEHASVSDFLHALQRDIDAFLDTDDLYENMQSRRGKTTEIIESQNLGAVRRQVYRNRPRHLTKS